MVAVLIILAVVFFLISMSLHNSADKQEAKYSTPEFQTGGARF